jgi:hypothetical protein
VPGRSEARIFTSVWKEGEFRALSVHAQWLFFFLLSQPDLTHCGVIPFRPGRWAGKTQGLSDEAAEAAADELAKAEFVVIDRGTGELLVRSLVRRDRVLRQPFLIIPLTDAINDVESVRIRAMLLTELTRIRGAGEVNDKVAGDVDRLISLLSGHSNTHPDTHSECQSDRHSDTHSASHSESQPDRQAGRDSDRDTETHTGGRGSNGSNHKLPLTPVSPESPPPPPRAPRADANAATAKPEGEADADRSPDDFAALVAEVRAVRRDWSTPSIERALSNEAVRERPWPLVRAAALALARDPQSQQPGRLAHDGPWWHRPAVTPVQSRPAWCGSCDERTRLIDDGADRVRPCPACHPTTARPA